MTPMRTIMLALALAAGLVSPSLAGSAPKVLVELFTSQGCNSCPKADAYFGELAQRDDVVALSYHVDYWDYLGWKDTLARPENVMRQEAYRAALGARSKYTPQMVVHGADHAIGSDRNAVGALVEAAKTGLPASVVLSMRHDDGKLVISAGKATGSIREANLVLAYFGDTETVAVGRGENEGRSITYWNPVRGFTSLGTWHGEEMRVELPLADFSMHKAVGCALFLQETTADGKPGRILGATDWSFKKAGL